MLEDYTEHESAVFESHSCDDDDDTNYFDSDGYFAMLPDELVQQIFQRLDMKSYLRLSYTCSRLYNVCFF